MEPLRIGLVGDRSDEVPAHVAIPPALRGAGRRLGVAVEPVWLPTDDLPDDDALAAFDALWCVPASPYRDMDGALRAIRVARERERPFLGTCGGFQHALLEWARDVAGIAARGARGVEPGGGHARRRAARLLAAGRRGPDPPGARLARGAADGGDGVDGALLLLLRPEPARSRPQLLGGPLVATGWDDEGDVRVVELHGHPFYLATLFQPERSSTEDAPHGLIVGLVAAAAGVEAPAVSGAAS